MNALSNEYNRQRLYWAMVVVTFLLLSLTSGPVRADVGPKPAMDFTFAFEGEASDITIGEMYECDQSDCSDAALLEELGPQGFRCTTNTCNSIAYGYADYHKIRITFADGRVLESNIFEKDAFQCDVYGDCHRNQPGSQGKVEALRLLLLRFGPSAHPGAGDFDRRHLL